MRRGLLGTIRSWRPRPAFAVVSVLLAMSWLLCSVVTLIPALGVPPAYRLVALALLSIAIFLTGVVSLCIDLGRAAGPDMTIALLLTPLFHLLVLMAQPSLKEVAVILWATLFLFSCRGGLKGAVGASFKRLLVKAGLR